ncbi:cyclin-domain-containing protein [Phanerochaete sordida]|uniref:Cyclin-domain-containing protein n=1 Tax=Phanerochaete sordida TaxID=48140 RepID=A0A9P3FZ31_9APHY|nr:cyclin-domain-containing protein [Phanerochaete sordida]
MLALAPPVQQHPSVSYSQPASASSSTRPSRSASRRSSSYSSSSAAASSSASTVTAPPNVRASTQEGPSSPRRTGSQHLPSSAQYHASYASQNGSGHHAGDGYYAAEGAEGSRSALRPNPEPAVDVHAYDPHELLRLLASLLTQIATTNDGLHGRDLSPAYQLHAASSPSSPTSDAHQPPIWFTLTTASRSALSSNMSLTFHARNVPTITLEMYLLRILKYCPASNEVFLSLLVYFDRMSKLAKEACGKAFVIDSYNIHRLVIAGVTVASKFFSDVFYTNSRYAKVGGLPQHELNQLELQFLLLNDFRLMISAEEMQRYAEQLIQFSQSNRHQASPAASPLPSPVPPIHQSPARPSNFMVPPSREPSHHEAGHQTPQVGPRMAYGRSSGSYSSAYSTAESETASEAGTETDFDGSTDDEPTIRPSHSSASSETMSLRSAGDADSIYTDDGDRSEVDAGAEAHTPSETSMRDYRMMSP